MKITSMIEGQVLMNADSSDRKWIRLVPPDLRAVDGDPEGPMPVVEVWFAKAGHLEGRLCWTTAGSSDKFRDFENPEVEAPYPLDET